LTIKRPFTGRALLIDGIYNLAIQSNDFSLILNTPWFFLPVNRRITLKAKDESKCVNDVTYFQSYVTLSDIN
jgi:hypothetical protein